MRDFFPDIRGLQQLQSISDEYFDAWCQTVPDKHWVKFDLSALRIGYELGRAIERAERTVPFSWYDSFNDHFYRDLAQAEKAAAGRNLVRPVHLGDPLPIPLAVPLPPDQPPITKAKPVTVCPHGVPHCYSCAVCDGEPDAQDA